MGSSLDTSRMRWTGGTVALRRTGFRLMSTKDGPTTAVVHSRGEAPDSRGLVSLRCRPVTVGRTFVSSQDAGISGTIFHSWQGGSWMQLAPGAAELDIEGHSFVLADDDATIQVPEESSGRVLAFDGSVYNDQTDIPTESLSLRPRDLSSKERARITEPLITGISAVDVLTPVGRGQSLLLYGPKGSGKSTAMMQAIAAQGAAGVRCILVLLGCTTQHLEQVLASLRRRNAMSYTTVVTDLQPNGEVANPEVAPILATLVATSIAERARDCGEDVLLVQDEFGVHHSAYMTLFNQLEPDIWESGPVHTPTAILWAVPAKCCFRAEWEPN